ncbi:MAG: hypothetical protein IKX60_03995 [Bacteroidales bacterium]|nr:hypothetical protein [Bacteroidales bacterium]
MKKTGVYHVCLSSHDEVMFRSTADLNMGFNCLAVATLYTDSHLLAEGFMTTHYHFLLRTSSLREVMFRCRYAYARYFNTKYHRSGSIGEKRYFWLEIDGLYHTLSALNYVIRQGLHHGLAITPFGYPHCSANAFFRSDLGKNESPQLMPEWNRYKYLPANVKIPEKYRMSAQGALLREDVLDIALVEQYYVSPRNYMYQMNKIVDEKEIEKQKEENSLPLVTIDTIETGVTDVVLKEIRTTDLDKLRRRNMTDLELCSLIDDKLVPRYFKEDEDKSIYLLPFAQRIELYDLLWDECYRARIQRNADGFFANRYITEAQLKRCLCLP